MRSVIQLISSNWPYWNRTEGADHFFIVPHDFGACFHYQEEKAYERGILPLLQRASLVQTFGQRNHEMAQKMLCKRLKWRSPINLFHKFTKVHEQQSGRTSKTIHILTFPQSTQQPDDIVLPFVDAMPWEEIGVFVDEKDVPNLNTILTSIPSEVILRKQRLLANPLMKQAMLFPQPAQAGDAFHLVLNGLARKLPHDRSVYWKSGEKILNWTAGLVDDLKPW
uniref:Exostosin GT47 domain-containing protein n=1 Tax=Populus alba TaxID=43335 RepID=A0A4U5P401_POPAL|nr:hypothetical protein D5086_0000228580 [Populus alba]